MELIYVGLVEKLLIIYEIFSLRFKGEKHLFWIDDRSKCEYCPVHVKALVSKAGHYIWLRFDEGCDTFKEENGLVSVSIQALEVSRGVEFIDERSSKRPKELLVDHITSS